MPVDFTPPPPPPPDPVPVGSLAPNPATPIPFRLFTFDVEPASFEIAPTITDADTSPPRMRYYNNLLLGAKPAPYAGRQVIIVPLLATDPFAQAGLYITDAGGVPRTRLATLGGFDELTPARAPALYKPAVLSPGASYALLWSHNLAVVMRYWQRLTDIVRVDCGLAANATSDVRKLNALRVRKAVEAFCAEAPFFVVTVRSDFSFDVLAAARANGMVDWLDVRDSDGLWCDEHLTSIVGDPAGEAKLDMVNHTWQGVDAATIFTMLVMQQAGLGPTRGLVPVQMLRLLNSAINSPVNTSFVEALTNPSAASSSSNYVKDDVFKKSETLPAYCLQLCNRAVGRLYVAELLERESRRRQRNGWGGTGLASYVQVADAAASGATIPSLHAQLVSALQTCGATSSVAEELATYQAIWAWDIASAYSGLREIKRIQEVEWAVGELALWRLNHEPDTALMILHGGTSAGTRMSEASWNGGAAVLAAMASGATPVAVVQAGTDAVAATDEKNTHGWPDLGAAACVSPIYAELEKGDRGRLVGADTSVGWRELGARTEAAHATFRTASMSYFSQYLFGLSFKDLTYPSSSLGPIPIETAARAVALQSKIDALNGIAKQVLNNGCTADLLLLAWLHGPPGPAQWGMSRFVRLITAATSFGAWWAAPSVPAAHTFGKDTLTGYIKPSTSIVQALQAFYQAYSEAVIYQLLQGVGGAGAKPSDLLATGTRYVSVVAAFVGWIGGPAPTSYLASETTFGVSIVTPLVKDHAIDMLITASGATKGDLRVPMYFFEAAAVKNVPLEEALAGVRESDPSTQPLRTSDVAALRTYVDDLRADDVKRMLNDPAEVQKVSKKVSEVMVSGGSVRIAIPTFMNVFCGLLGTAIAMAEYTQQWERAGTFGKLAIVAGITKEIATTAGNLYGALKVVQNYKGATEALDVLKDSKGLIALDGEAAGWWTLAVESGETEARFVKIAGVAGAIVSVLQGLDLIYNPESALNRANDAGDDWTYKLTYTKAGVLIVSGVVTGAGLLIGGTVAAWTAPIGIIAGAVIVLIDWEISSSKTEFYTMRGRAQAMFRDDFFTATKGTPSKTRTQLTRLVTAAEKNVLPAPPAP